MRKTARDLKKREFEYFLKATICDVMRLFGYSKLPHVFETKLPGNEMMSFITIRNGKYSAIAYDYQKIAALFSRYDKEDAIARIVFITAHEMRHYYQHRQIRAISPRESEKTVNARRKSDVIRITATIASIMATCGKSTRSRLLILTLPTSLEYWS